MITALHAALLGLKVPLSPIMIAVLGLWPEPEDDDLQQPSQVYGSGRKRGSWAERHRVPLLLKPRGRTAPVDAPRRNKTDEAEFADKVRQHWDAIEAIREADRRTPKAADPPATALAPHLEPQKLPDAKLTSADAKRLADEEAIILMLLSELS